VKIEIKKFSTSFGEKKHPKTRVDCLFFYFESLLRIFEEWEKGKITETVAIAATYHPAKF